MTENIVAPSKAFEAHDHSHCVQGSLTNAEAHLQQRKARFTPPRRLAYETLLTEHKALGAYQILEALKAAGLGSQPVVAYRALEFLVEHGLVHRIEGKNAFLACVCPGKTHEPSQFLVCTQCDVVAEIPALAEVKAVEAKASTLGFQASETTIEVKGLCALCTASD